MTGMVDMNCCASSTALPLDQFYCARVLLHMHICCILLSATCAALATSSSCREARLLALSYKWGSVLQ